MKLRTLFLGLALVGLTANCALAQNGSLEERVSRLEQRLGAGQASLGQTLGIQIHGIVDGQWRYDFNRPDSDLLSLRPFDADDNTFTLDLFELSLRKPRGESGVGFRADLDFGKLAERISADWNGDGDFADTEEVNSVELQEAYLLYELPLIGIENFELQAGKFLSPMGSEVPESPLNYNISRSFLFSFGKPITNTGFLFNYPIPNTDLLTVSLGMVNGWDNVVDNNDGKSVTGAINLILGKQFSATLSGIFGPEQDSRADSKRGVVDFATYIKPVDDLHLVLEYLYASESDVPWLREANLSPPVGVGTGVYGDQRAEWQGFSGIFYLGGGLFAEALSDLSLAVRGEFFHDAQGTRIGVTRTGGGLGGLPRTSAATIPMTTIEDLNGALSLGDTCPSALCPVGGEQSLWAVTVTGAYRVTEGFLFRVEYRHDDSNRNDPGPFEFRSLDLAKNPGDVAGAPRFRSGQDTIGLQAAYVF